MENGVIERPPSKIDFLDVHHLATFDLYMCLQKSILY